MPRRLDLLPLAASALALAEAGLYGVLVAQEGGDPAWWAIAVLVGCGLAAVYAVRRDAPGRRVVLSVCAVLLGGLGYLAILSIGLPILLAGALCLAAVLRGRPERDWRDVV